jgi:hypothetical protein
LDSASVSIWTPQTVLGLSTLLLNVIVFAITLLLNFTVYNKRKKEDRFFQTEQKFFESTVIKCLDEIIAFPNALDKELSTLLEILSAGSFDQAKKRSAIENAIENIDLINSEFSREKIFIIQGYSKSLRDAIFKTSENLYDKTTEIFTELNSNTIDSLLKFFVSRKVAMLKDAYIDEIFFLLRKNKPSIE